MDKLMAHFFAPTVLKVVNFVNGMNKIPQLTEQKLPSVKWVFSLSNPVKIHRATLRHH